MTSYWFALGHQVWTRVLRLYLDKPLRGGCSLFSHPRAWSEDHCGSELPHGQGFRKVLTKPGTNTWCGREHNAMQISMWPAYSTDRPQPWKLTPMLHRAA